MILRNLIYPIQESTTSLFLDAIVLTVVCMLCTAENIKGFLNKTHIVFSFCPPSSTAGNCSFCSPSVLSLGVCWFYTVCCLKSTVPAPLV